MYQLMANSYVVETVKTLDIQSLIENFDIFGCPYRLNPSHSAGAEHLALKAPTAFVNLNKQKITGAPSI